MENHHHLTAVSNTTPQAGLMRAATLASVLVASGLVLLKLGAWWLTDSLSLLSSLTDSLLDVLASAVNFLAVRYALTPPDDDHRFGHGKAEDIAGLGQSMFIAGSSLFIFFEGLRRLTDPHPIEHNSIGTMVMVISVLATTGLVLFQRYAVKKTRSKVVQADSLHYVGDIFSNLGVILALYLSSAFGWNLADPVIAFVIAIYILHGAWEIGFASFHNLMDREFDATDRQAIVDIVTAHPAVRGLHDLKTRRSGIYHFIQLHVGMDGAQPLRDAHAVVDALELEIMKKFPHSDVIIHQDPV